MRPFYVGGPIGATKYAAVGLGSARDSRAGDGDPAIANFLLPRVHIRRGESPRPARESRALPRTNGTRRRSSLQLNFVHRAAMRAGVSHPARWRQRPGQIFLAAPA